MKTNTKRMGMYLQTAVAMVVACCAMLVSCQKAVIDEEGGEVDSYTSEEQFMDSPADDFAGEDDEWN